MTQTPKISFIVAYKNQDNLSDCLKKLLNQSFSNIEVVCVGNGTDSEALEIVQNLMAEDERVKLVTAPLANKSNEVKAAGLGISSGEFVYFINGNNKISDNFVQDICFEIAASNEIEIKDNYLYRRTFLENNKEITNIIQNKINQETEKFAEFFETEKKQYREEFDNLNRNNVENLKNSTYEITYRFNQLEKTVWEKDAEYRKLIQEESKKCEEKCQEINTNLQKDIASVYDYINSEVSKKNDEIANVYNEITNRTNSLESAILDKVKELQKSDKDEVMKKLQGLEKEIVVRYVNIKRLLDIQSDEINLKLNQLGISSSENVVDLNKVLNENIDKLYSQLNKTSSLFYEELSKTYKDFNEKINAKDAEEKNELEQRLSYIRNEFESKLQNLRDEIIK